MKNIKLLIVFTLLVFTSAEVFAAGGSRNGTAGASQLLIPVGARGIAMGGGTLTGSQGIESIYWNPANLAMAEQNTNVMFTQMSYIADISVIYGAVSTKLGSLGHLAFGIKSLSMDEIPITTVTHPDGNGQYYTPQFVTMGLTYSKLLSDRISVGFTANYLTETLDRVSASGIAFNVGLTYRNLGNINGLSIAFAIKNLGPDMEYDGSALYIQASNPDFSRGDYLYKIDAAKYSLPSTLELGVGYNVEINESNSVIFDGAFENSNFYGDEYKIGAEYSFDNLFFVRGGYKHVSNLNEGEENIYGITLGAGLNYEIGGGVNFQFDYAYRQVEYFDANHIFDIKLGL